MKASNFNFLIALINTLIGIGMIIGGTIPYASMVLVPFNIIVAFICRNKLEGNTLSKELDYEQRWTDADYVAMVHRTRRVEGENGIDPLTPCECTQHKPKAIPTPPGGDGGGSKAITTGAITANEIRMANHKYKDMEIDGNIFTVPYYIPDDAKTSSYEDHNSGLIHGLFSWYNTQGRHTAFRAITSHAMQRQMRSERMRKAQARTSNVSLEEEFVEVLNGLGERVAYYPRIAPRIDTERGYK